MILTCIVATGRCSSGRGCSDERRGSVGMPRQNGGMSDVVLPEWAASLGLRPHPEGGHYVETYRSATTIPASALPGHGADRPSATAIHFLLMPGECSAWHRVKSDELWLHHRGGRLGLDLGGDADDPALAETITLGPDPDAGHHLQGLVPAHVWQRATPLDDEPVLVTCIVTPGFDFADFELRRD